MGAKYSIGQRVGVYANGESHLSENRIVAGEHDCCIPFTEISRIIISPPIDVGKTRIVEGPYYFVKDDERLFHERYVHPIKDEDEDEKITREDIIEV